MTTIAPESAERGRPAPHTTIITVNERPVEVPAPKVTGLSIKEAAINQGVAIQPDFVLSEEKKGGGTRIIGDQDEVTVNKESRFVAIAPDDNS
jgi:hypothetical protein